jgi:glycosyltransferase involved in cell wall biosynthesis
VTFAGLVDQDEIQAYYNDADAFVLPSFAEGVPVVLMEAMAKGLPVITTRIMGIPELVEHEVSGLLVPPGRVDCLVDAITRLAGDGSLRQTLGRQGRDRVCGDFDVRQSGRQLASLFQGLAASDDSARVAASDRLAAGATES